MPEVSFTPVLGTQAGRTQLKGYKDAVAVPMGLSMWPLQRGSVRLETFTPASVLQVIGPRETEPGKSWIVLLAWPHMSRSVTYTMV